MKVIIFACDVISNVCFVVVVISLVSLLIIHYLIIIPFLRTRHLIGPLSGLVTWTQFKELKLYRDCIESKGLPKKWLKTIDLLGKLCGISALLFLVLSIVYGLIVLK